MSLDYANARLRGMRSRLLSEAQIEHLARSPSLPAFIAELTHTPYRDAVNAALTQLDGVACVDQALRTYTINLMRKIAGFYPPTACFRLMQTRYDVHNIKTILRGLYAPISAEEIASLLMPLGTISYPVLREVLTEPTMWDAIDRLISLDVPLALPLLALRQHSGEPDLMRIERRIEQTAFDHALAGKACLHWAMGEADLTNMLTAARLVAHQVPPRQELWVGPGYLAFKQLAQAARQPDVTALVKSIGAMPYGRILEAAAQAYAAQNKRLSAFEQRLHAGFRQQRIRQITQDPLGPGVLIGYLTLAEGELLTLRWLARGLRLRLTTEALLAGLREAV